MNSIQKKIIKIASKILADYEYIYDPDHKKNPGEGFEKTEKGWSKEKQEKSKGVAEGVDDYLMRTEPLYCAGHPQASEHQLDELSNSDNHFVRNAVSRNPSAHSKTLEKLSNDEEAIVRAGVAQNPSAHPKTLEKLSNDDNEKVRNEAITTLKTRKK